MKPRMKPADRKSAILEAAVVTATKIGFANLRLRAVAEAAECNHSLVVSHFGTMEKLCKAVMRRAIFDRNLKIIAQGVAIGHPVALKVDPVLRQAALDSLSI